MKTGCPLALTSPRLSPLSPRERGGGNGSRALAKPVLNSARWLPSFSAMNNGCSLSQRERARVRENSAGKLQATTGFQTDL